MGTDCHILTPSSSDHSSTSFAFWLGCSTVGHWGPKPSVWSWFSLRHLISNWNCNSNSNWLKLSVAPGYIIVWRHLLPASVRICTEFNHVHNSRWYSDVFDRIHLFRCSSAYLHRCISWLTARSRVSMLQKEIIFINDWWYGYVTSGNNLHARFLVHCLRVHS